MIFELEVNGRTQVVNVEPVGSANGRGGVFRLTIGVGADAEVIEIDARRTDLGLSMLDLASRRAVDAAVSSRSGGEILVQLPHVDLRVVADGRRYRPADAAPAGTGEQRVTSPMPGRVLRVLVKPGDEVAAGQPVVVIEAMKMENEMKVARAGRVRDVHVTEATSVEAGRLLVVVD